MNNSNLLDEIIDQMKITGNRLLANKFWMIGTLLFSLLFIVLAWNSYENFIKPKISEHKLNKEFLNKNSLNNEDILIMYFYTDWCPYCKKAEPEWEKFKQYVNNINNTNDYKIDLVSINCDEKKDIADKYEIDGYPTVKLIYKDTTYDFDAKVTKENLVELLDSVK